MAATANRRRVAAAANRRRVAATANRRGTPIPLTRVEHRIDLEQWGPAAPDMAGAVQACVHCGFCLPACPTYGELGQEMDSPRGRIVLMKEVLEGGLALSAALPYIDRCLGCLSCEPACPSGVPYRALLSPFREQAELRRRRGWMERLRRLLILETIPYPARFRAAARLGLWAKPFRRWIPATLRPMLDLLPDRLPAPRSLPERIPARGETRARVALLTGCAQQALAPGINRATVELLTGQGVEVVIPRDQGCCGALAWHVGEGERARACARRNLAAFPATVDAVVTNAAGCGSGLHEYPLILQGCAEEDQAKAFSARVVDVCVFLDRLGLRSLPDRGEPLRVAYHDACHLANGQGVREEPRRLLRAVPGLELVEIPGGPLCCGSAGTYNLDQPAVAAALGADKAGFIARTGCTVLATGNIGCLTQLRLHLDRLGASIRVLHTVEILAEAARRQGPPESGGGTTG